MTRTDLVIFDCDGVLVDSEIVAARVEAAMLAAAGFEIAADELLRRYAGLVFKDILLRIEEEHGHPFQASLIEETEKEVDRRLADELVAIEGAAEAVAAVTGPKCVCSNSGMARLRSSLGRAGLLGFFEGRIFPAPDTPGVRPKPAPDIFLHAAQAMGAEPGRTFVIEDSVHGVSGAKAAGMRVIGFTGASHAFPGHADLLTEAGAETTIRSLRDLPRVLQALAGWAAPV